MASVLAHEHGHAGGLGLGGERLSIGEVVGDGLLDQGHDAATNCLAGNAQVQAIGSGDDHAIRLDLVHHDSGVGVERHAGGLGRGAGALEGIGDGHELGAGLLGHEADVVAAHGTGADDGDADGGLVLGHGNSSLGQEGRPFLPSRRMGWRAARPQRAGVGRTAPEEGIVEGKGTRARRSSSFRRRPSCR